MRGEIGPQAGFARIASKSMSSTTTSPETRRTPAARNFARDAPEVFGTERWDRRRRARRARRRRRRVGRRAREHVGREAVRRTEGRERRSPPSAPSGWKPAPAAGRRRVRRACAVRARHHVGAHLRTAQRLRGEYRVESLGEIRARRRRDDRTAPRTDGTPDPRTPQTHPPRLDASHRISERWRRQRMGRAAQLRFADGVCSGDFGGSGVGCSTAYGSA